MPALTRIYPNGYTERECLAQCTVNANCYAIQAVYGDENVDFVEIGRNVEWCALLYVDESGANITNRSSDWSSSAFSVIETWATTNAPSHTPLTSGVIQNDQTNKPVAALVKGSTMFLETMLSLTSTASSYAFVGYNLTGNRSTVSQVYIANI